MSKTLTRILALVLIPSLLANPSFALALNTRHPSNVSLPASLFTQQALIGRIVAAIFPGKNERTAHGSVHRLFRSFWKEALAGGDVSDNPYQFDVIRPEYFAENQNDSGGSNEDDDEFVKIQSIVLRALSETFIIPEEAVEKALRSQGDKTYRLAINMIHMFSGEIPNTLSLVKGMYDLFDLFSPIKMVLAAFFDAAEAKRREGEIQNESGGSNASPSLGAFIQQSRVQKRWTQSQLAEKLKFSTSYIGTLERDSIPYLPEETGRALARVLDVSEETLLNYARSSIPVFSLRDLLDQFNDDIWLIARNKDVNVPHVVKHIWVDESLRTRLLNHLRRERLTARHQVEMAAESALGTVQTAELLSWVDRLLPQWTDEKLYEYVTLLRVLALVLKGQRPTAQGKALHYPGETIQHYWRRWQSLWLNPGNGLSAPLQRDLLKRLVDLSSPSMLGDERVEIQGGPPAFFLRNALPYTTLLGYAINQLRTATDPPIHTIFFPAIGAGLKEVLDVAPTIDEQTIVGVDREDDIEDYIPGNLLKTAKSEVYITGIIQPVVRYQYTFKYRSSKKTLILYVGNANELTAAILPETAGGYDMYFSNYNFDYASVFSDRFQEDVTRLNSGGLLILNKLFGGILAHEIDVSQRPDLIRADVFQSHPTQFAVFKKLLPAPVPPGTRNPIGPFLIAILPSSLLLWANSDHIFSGHIFTNNISGLSLSGWLVSSLIGLVYELLPSHYVQALENSPAKAVQFLRAA